MSMLSEPHIDWGKHKAELQTLYLAENPIHEGIKAYMKETYNVRVS